MSFLVTGVTTTTLAQRVVSVAGTLIIEKRTVTVTTRTMMMLMTMGMITLTVQRKTKGRFVTALAPVLQH